MSGLVVFIGGLSVVFGAYDILIFGADGEKDWKKPVIKIIGGLAVVGVGLLMKQFGV